MPMASTMPNSDRLFSEKPNTDMIAKVPISETGIASNGTSDARQLCRNISTTSATRPIASKSVFTTSLMLSRTNVVVSSLLAR